MLPSDMVPDHRIKSTLQDSKRILVIGMSRNELKPAGYVPRYLRQVGYQIIPLNPLTDEIDGLKTLKSVSELKEAVDIVDVFRPSEDVPDIIKELLKCPDLYKALWLQEGIYDESVTRLRDLGKEVIWNRCMMKEHQRLIG